MKQIHAPQLTEFQRRRGTLLPAIAVALLVVGAALGLVLDTLWKDAATRELQNVADAVALAAAGEFLNERLLLPETSQENLAEHAKLLAAEVAAVNQVVGTPVTLNLSGENSDIQFGRRHAEEDQTETVFLQTNIDPEMVHVHVQRSRSQGSPIRLFLAGVTKQPVADAEAFSNASFDNRISHFETTSLPIPALPVAILANDPAAKRTDTWNYCINQRLGQDQYRYDETTRQVVAGADGIPEIVLTSVSVNNSGLDSNFQLLDFNNRLSEPELIRQITKGLMPQDLELLSGRLPAQDLMELAGSGYVAPDLQQALESQTGQQRLVLLYHQGQSLSVPSWSNLLCQDVVAIRIMRVLPQADNRVTLIVQPTVMSTRTAVLTRFVNESAEGSQLIVNEADAVMPNPYIYKIYLDRR